MPAYYDERTKTWFCKFYYTDYTGTKRQKMKRGAEKANIPFIRIHDMRHSHVSLLINMGFSPHLIAEEVGVFSNDF